MVLADEAAAGAAAITCGGRVEIGSERTESSQIYANPDGSQTIEQYAYPQRVRRPDGTWADLDATLLPNPDGSYSPRASTVEMTLSGGGEGSLLTGRRADTAFTLTWPDALPAPVVSGASATYAEIMPGVDLIVTAQETGFSEVLVVKNRLAAKNPKLRRFAFGSSLSGLSWRATDGRLAAVDRAGRPVLQATAPRMWDSSTAPNAAAMGGRSRGSVDGPAEAARTEPIDLTVHGDELALEPSATMLDDPGAEYPVYLDPSIVYSHWTMINSQFPNQSYWSYDKTDCPSPFTGECAKVGQAVGYTMDYRSMWEFPTAEFRGKLITSAKFSIDLLYSAWTAASITQLREVGASLNSGTTWGNNSGAWSGTVTATVTNASWPAARKLTEFEGSLPSRLQAIANGTATTTTWGLRAETETSNAGWKKFDAKTARLVVGVNTKPNMPDTLTVDGRACVAGPGRPVISTATPVLKGRVTDPDGHSMQAWYAWAKWNGSSFVDVGGGNNSPHASGAFAEITTGTLEHGGVYTFRMQTNDSPSVPGTGQGVSDVTHMPGNCEWEVDLADPVVPTVTGDIYPQNNTGCPAQGCGSVGQTGRFTFTSSADVVTYRWGFTSPPTTVLNASAGTATLDWTPPDGGAKTLFVQAVDRAGRTATKAYQFTVAPPSTAHARWKLDDLAGSTELVDDTGNGWAGTPHGSPTLGSDGRLVPGLDGATRTAVGLDGVDDNVTAVPAAVPDTSRSFSAAAWARVDDVTTNRTVLGQQGTNNSAFWIEATSGGAWRITTTAADSATAATASAAGTTAVRPGVWTHLAGVYDSAAKTLKLYVNGVAEATVSGVTTWDGTGLLVIGGSSRRWKGAIADVQLWNRVISPAEVFALVDPIGVGNVGEWHMDEVGPGPAFDASGMARDLTFYGGAEIPASGAGQSGTGLRLDGVDDYVTPDLPVLRTDQSLTISAWAKLGQVTSQDQMVVNQGPVSLFFRGWEGKWGITVQSPNGAGGYVNAEAWSNVAAVPGQWAHLVGVFDASTGQVRLYVNGVLQTAVATGATGEGSAQALTIGARGSGWLFGGDIDEVRVYQGVVADVTRIP
jgi:hypothetical protein